MDQSNSGSNNDRNSNSNEFNNLVNISEEHHHHHHRNVAGDSIKREEIFPSYDFQPVRPAATSSPRANIDSGDVGGGEARSWHSADSRTNSSPVKNYGFLESLEPAKVISRKDHNSFDADLLGEIDQTTKKYADNLLHALEGVSRQLSKLETRTCQLKNSVDEVKVAIGENHRSTDGKMRQLENLLREVQTNVQVIRDKEDIMDAQLQVIKLQFPKVDQQPEIHNTVSTGSVQPTASVPQQIPPASLSQLPPTFPSHSALPSPPQQNPPHVQVPNQFALNQVPPAPHRDCYYPQPTQVLENAGQPYQVPSTEQLHSALPQQHPQQLQPTSIPQPLPQQQYQALPQPQYLQPQPPSPNQPRPSLLAHNPSQPQSPLGHYPDETPFIQSQNYPPSIHQTSAHPPSGAPQSQQYYGASPNMYDGQHSRPGPGFSSTAYGPSSGPGESYPYSSSPLQYGSGPPMKPQQLISPVLNQTSGTGYPQLSTPRILPHASATTSLVSGGSDSAGTGNRVPIDDVVDRAISMGFPIEQVRATVRKLTENGQLVDLNMVLDKLMNDGKVQPPRAWFGR